MNIILDPKYHWTSESHKGASIHYVGKFQSNVPSWQNLPTSSPNFFQDLIHILNTQKSHFAGIIDTADYIIAFVDYVRSYPVFYSQANNQFLISNSARLIKEKHNLTKVDEIGLLEFTMSGYVTGLNTVYEELHQLQAGELLYYDKINNNLKLHRYFQYHPVATELRNEKEYIEELDILMNRIFSEIIERANGSPIWIPLSGGLDSRLIVCKLHQLGYNNLHTFSYGPRGNYEAKAAKAVAETIGVPWIPVESKPSRARNIFQSQKRIEYWNFADGLSVLPSMGDYEAFHTLRENKLLPDNAIIINGQSGDFTTGGHIQLDLLVGTCSVNNMLKAILHKHFNVWKHIRTKDNLDKIEYKILQLLGLDQDIELSMDEISSYYEQWEWQERQSKYVVNGQRLYDYYGYQWELPLWDGEFVRFYNKIPLKNRLKQSLYIHYLEHYDYKGLFKDYRSENRRWPGLLQYLIPIFDRLEHFALKNKHRFTNTLSFWGHYHDLYSLYGFNNFLKVKAHVTMPPHGRAIAALGIQEWLYINKLPLRIDAI